MSNEEELAGRVQELEGRVSELRAENKALLGAQLKWMQICAGASILSCIMAAVITLMGGGGAAPAPAANTAPKQARPLPPQNTEKKLSLPEPQDDRKKTEPVAQGDDGNQNWKSFDPIDLPSTDAGEKPVSEKTEVQKKALPKAKPRNAAQELSRTVTEEPPREKRKTVFLLPEAPKNRPKTELYTVRKGDSLWSISKHFYGNYDAILKIKKDNGLASDNLTVGMVLKIRKP